MYCAQLRVLRSTNGIRKVMSDYKFYDTYCSVAHSIDTSTGSQGLRSQVARVETHLNGSRRSL